MIDTVGNFLDDRFGIKEFLRKQGEHPVGRHVNFFYCFGGLTAFFFALQVLTGALLAVYYVPSPAEAHASVEYIQKEVAYGWLIRGLHHWGSSGMVVMIGIHMLRVFFTGAYKPPRELNWVVGVALLGLTLGFSFTGYLLPWDQKAYWATVVGTKITETPPLIGGFLLHFVRGGADLSGVTLVRFFAIHVMILPMTIVALMLGHFIMIRKQGISGPL